MNDIIQEIKSLETHFGAIWEAQNVRLSSHEVEMVGRVYKALNAPGKRLNLACADCIRNSLAFIAVWWQENKQHYEIKVEEKQKRKK